jgi:acyl phosphate:glycerol-3-phosphate acyltransferase
MMAFQLILTIVVAYLIGSVPTAYLMGRLLKGIDIREHGSGNVGATNVMRVLGTPAGISTLGIDVLKGYAVIAWVAPAMCSSADYRPIWMILSAIAVIAGHNWMIFLGFTGGKGVATTGGAFLALAPAVTLSAVAVWAVTVAFTRYVSLGSILAGISIPIFMRLYGQPRAYFWFSLFLTLALVAKHRGNIKRLIAGTERKLGVSEKVPE